MMKKINLILVIFLITFSSVASGLSDHSRSEVSDQDRYEMTVSFLKKYDDKYSCHKWKIVMKSNKVTCQRLGGVVNIHLYNNYFDSQLEKGEQE